MMFVLCLLLSASSFTSVFSATLDRDNQTCEVEFDNSTNQLKIDEIWTTDDPCLQYRCALTIDTVPELIEIRENCTTACRTGYELQNIPGKCCGVCVKTKCFYMDKIYEVGETWHNENRCMLYECILDNNAPVISTFKKTCPVLPTCSPKDVYTKDCCQYCRDSKLLLYDLFGETDPPLENYEGHPCKRECLKGAAPMTCEYKFEVEWYETLSKACYDCPSNSSHCNRPHCVTGDGVRRSILVVNRMMPGPAIEVCLNDTIIVDVTNSLLGDSTTIHWHGLHQKETPYMDGVPNLTQCPIVPHTTFRYKFRADNSGTHFWHSHVGLQRGDGCYGALIIHKPEDPHRKLYDYDLTSHIVIMQDWIHTNGISMFTSHHHSIGDNKPVNILVNGKGRYLNSEKIVVDLIDDDHSNGEATTYSVNPVSSGRGNSVLKLKELSYSRTQNITDRLSAAPFEVFNVTKGYRYRFRTINSGFLNCPIIISVDNHSLLVIQSDGYDLEPIEVKSIVSYAGERFDFILNANEEVGSYWMRFKGVMDCDERFGKVHQVAIVRYEGAPDIEPTEAVDYDYPVIGLEFNPLNKGPGHVGSITISEASALEEDEDWVKQVEADFKFYLYYDFYMADHSMFYRPPLYGVGNVSKIIYTPQLNHISLKIPPVPLLPARDDVDEGSFCNETSLKEQGIDCENQFCECHHVLKVPLNSVVELVLVDEGHTYDANHPFHLHGHAFRVIGMDRIGNEVTIDQIKDLDDHGQLQRNLLRPPIKDTVTVPDGGYSIIRFKADNPGFWLFHCHIEFHAEVGMALIFKVGENSEMVTVPKDFPKCSNYMPNAKNSLSSTSSLVLHPLIVLCLALISLIVVI